MWMCTRITRTYQTCCRFCLFHTNPGFALVEERHAWKKLNIDEKYAATISEGTILSIAKCFIEVRPEVDDNTTRARTSLCPVQTNVLYVRVSYCRCCRRIYVGYAWYVTGPYVRTRTNIEKCNNRLGIDMNTEPFLIVPDEVVHDVKNQATKVRRDHSFRWIQPRCSSLTMTHASDRTATLRRWCSHPRILSLRCHAAAVCMLVEKKSRVWVDFEKKMPEQKYRCKKSRDHVQG